MKRVYCEPVLETKLHRPMNTVPAVPDHRKPAAYSGDAFAYSLPGGFIKATPGARPEHVDAQTPEAGVERDRERTLIVTDVACDLPADWLARERAVMLPMKLRFDSRMRTDAGVAESARAFFNHDLADISSNAQALPLSASGAYDFIFDHLPTRADFVLHLSLASSRGHGYMNSLTAAQNLMLQHGRTRRQAGVTRPFKMWVIDSTTALNGHGLLVGESVRVLNEGMSVPRVVQHIDALRKQVHTLAVPPDVSFFYRHNRIEGDAAIPWLSYGVGKMLDRTPILHGQRGSLSVAAQARGAEAAIVRALNAVTQKVADKADGLLAPFVCVSYAGDIAQLSNLAAFAALASACSEHQATLLVATMSMTNALVVGAGGLAISLACESLLI